LSNGNGAAAPERAIIVGLILRATSRTTVEEHLEELARLAEAAGASVVATATQDRPTPDPATFIGRGKAEELQQIATETKADVVIVDDDLSPAQARNLAQIIGVKVVDRSALILDIFARRAKSREARTQVELAQMKYLLPRLTRQWTHLERQAGGIGTRGVGETQLELDRRIIRTRISRLEDDLEKIEKTRETQRRGRRDVFTVALVGYTNAGKSTLFNQLTAGNVEAVDKLFATLDARLQRSVYEMPRPTVFIDTVGFIRKLPHHLVASFRSTMEEAVAADLVLHLINLSHPQFEEQRDVGKEVLRDLGIRDDRMVEVYNKIDAVDGGVLAGPRRRDAVTISALTGKGIPDLLEIVRAAERASGRTLRLDIPNADARTIARLYEVAEVIEQTAEEEVLHFVAWMPEDVTHLFASFERR
jgi:GTPase